MRDSRGHLEFFVKVRVLRLGHSVFKLQSQPGHYTLPFAQWHCPFLADVGQGQLEQFQLRIVTRERPPVRGDLAHTSNQLCGLNAIGLMDDPPNTRLYRVLGIGFASGLQANPTQPSKAAKILNYKN